MATERPVTNQRLNVYLLSSAYSRLSRLAKATDELRGTHLALCSLKEEAAPDWPPIGR